MCDHYSGDRDKRRDGLGRIRFAFGRGIGRISAFGLKTRMGMRGSGAFVAAGAVEKLG